MAAINLKFQTRTLLHQAVNFAIDGEGDLLLKQKYVCTLKNSVQKYMNFMDIFIESGNECSRQGTKVSSLDWFCAVLIDLSGTTVTK